MVTTAVIQREYVWVEQAGVYRHAASGQFVARAEIQGALNGVINASRAHMQTITASLRAGEISLANWQSAMMAEVKSGHLASAAAQRGGWAQMTQADYGRVGQIVRQEYGYLANYAEQIAAGTHPVSVGRAGQYAGAFNETGENFHRREMAQHGYDEERNVLMPGDSCTSGGGRTGCVDVTALGWQPVGTLSLPGQRRCLGNCRCHLQYRNSQTGAITD